MFIILNTSMQYMLRVQFSHLILSDFLWPHELQDDRLPCPSPTPGACSNSGPLSQWCHPIISSSVIHFSSCLQSFPASGSFQMSQFFASGGQSTGVSASASVLPMHTQDWFFLRIAWFDLFAVQGTLKSLLQYQYTLEKHKNFFLFSKLLLTFCKR